MPGIGVLALWIVAVIILLAMIVLFGILGTKPLMAIVNHGLKRKIEADIWDKTCQTDIISQRDNSMTEVDYNHVLEITYEVDDGEFITTYHSVMPVGVEEYNMSREGERMELGHLHSKLLGISRIVPQLSTKLVVQSIILCTIPILWLILIEAVINSFVAELSLPPIVCQVTPAVAIVVGLLLYALAFWLNLFHLRHDLITSQVAHAGFTPSYRAPAAARSVNPDINAFERVRKNALMSNSTSIHDDDEDSLIVEEQIVMEEDDKPPARRSGSGAIKSPRAKAPSTSVYDDEEDVFSFDSNRPTVTLEPEDD